MKMARFTISVDRFHPSILAGKYLFPFLGFLAFTAVLGCGPAENGATPTPSADRSSGEARSPRTERGPSPAPSDTGGGWRADGVAPVPHVSDTEARLESLREEIEGGANPDTAEILYSALSDPDPKVRGEVSEWLRLIVEQDEASREKIERLQTREPNRDVWRRTADLLTPRGEPVEELPPPEAEEDESG